MAEQIYYMKKVSISDRMVEIMKEKITSGEWKPGSRIPSENELAQMFGVSRLTARNAIQRLDALGILDIKVGDGTYIKENPLEGLLHEASGFLVGDKILDDLSEFRQFFETDCMVLACARRTDEELKQLEEIHRSMSEAAEKGDEQTFIENDMKMHKLICQMTHNSFFELVYRLNENNISKHYQQNNISYASVNHFSLDPKDDDYYLIQLAKEHEGYITALKERNPAPIMSRLENYLEQYKKIRHI